MISEAEYKYRIDGLLPRVEFAIALNRKDKMMLVPSELMYELRAAVICRNLLAKEVPLTSEQAGVGQSARDLN